jgi:hypothetical protein
MIFGEWSVSALARMRVGGARLRRSWPAHGCHADGEPMGPAPFEQIQEARAHAAGAVCPRRAESRQAAASRAQETEGCSRRCPRSAAHRLESAPSGTRVGVAIGSSPATRSVVDRSSFRADAHDGVLRRWPCLSHSSSCGSRAMAHLGGRRGVRAKGGPD